ncbi:MAG: energy-coupling factor ABC transporter permease [Lachnospiraceae bacterium]|nr:energy-coupling factor ABC transporter permease [Lachnospiraceae bacterium]
MHMADALIVPAVAGTMYVASTVAAGVSVREVKLENETKKIPVMGVMGAFVFAAQMINFTIPGTGSSGHLCGGMMLSALLGPYAGFLTMIGVLLVQCLFFADGGLLALGCNVWNMAFYGCFIGALLIWRPIMKKGVSKGKIILASMLGCVLTLQLGAFSVCLETFFSGVTELPFSVFLMTMQPIHLAIGAVEGLITSAVLVFVHEARPEMLWGVGETEEGKFSFKNTLVILGVLTALVGGILSLFASAFPDGLEWSIERITGSTELESAGGIYDVFASIQEKTAFLPDYALKGSESAVGTTISGIVGAVIVLLLCVAVSYVFKFFRNQNKETVKGNE